MARVQTKVTQTAEKEIRYRFTCENCGHETEWIEGKVVANADATYKGYVSSSQARAQIGNQLKEKASGNLAAAIRNNKEALEKGRALSMLMFPKNKCPKCKKIQSWTMAGSVAAKILIFAIFFIGIGFTVALFIQHPEYSFFAQIWPLFACLLPVCVVAIIGDRRTAKHRKEIISKNIKSLEIDWMDGSLPVKY